MKNISLFVTLLFTSFSLLSQTPNMFNYQGMIRNEAGEGVEGEIRVQVAIHDQIANGTVLYSEEHLVQAVGGLFSVVVGSGEENVVGSFSAIDWGGGDKFLEVGIDPDAGQNFQISSTTQLLSVPYALHAQSVTNVDDADADPTNEIELPSQQASDAGMVLTADGAGGVTYAQVPGGANDDPTNELLTGAVLNGTNLELTDAGGTTSVDLSSLVNDVDEDTTNELLVGVALNGTNLDLTDAGGTTSVDLSPINTDNQDLYLDGSNLMIEGGSTPIPIGGGANTDNQNLTLNGTTLEISGGTSADLSSLIDDADADATNENQTVSAGTGITVNQTGQDFEVVNAAPDQVVSITDGGSGNVTVGGTYPNLTIDVASLEDSDSDPTNELLTGAVLNGTTLELTDAGGTTSVDVAAIDTDTDEQTLSFNGTNLSISDGNSVDLSGLSGGSGWSLSGNATGALGTLGTTDDNSISIVTNSAERMRIDNAGDVGIGVADPLHQVHVEGQTSNSNLLDPLSNLTGEPYEVGMYSSHAESGDANTDNIGAAFQVNGTGRNFGLAGIAMDNNATDNYAMYAQALNGSASNVGINADAESSTGDNYGAITRGDGATSGNNYGLWANAGNSSNLNIAIYADAEGNGTNETYGVEARAEGANENYALYGFGYSTTGNNYGVVGRSDGNTTGTNYGVFGHASGANTNYAGYFDGDVAIANGDLNINGSYTLPGADGTADQIMTTDGNGNVSWQDAAGGGSGWGLSGNATGSLGTFGTTDANDIAILTNNVERMRVGANGNIGIGIPAPVHPLDVYGQMSAISAVALGGGAGDLAIGLDAVANSGALRNYGIQSQVQNGTLQNIALNAQAESTVGDNYGGRTFGEGATSGINYGLHARAENSSSQNIAVLAEADGASSNGNYGGRFLANGSGTINRGLEGTVTGAGNTNAAISGFASGGTVTNIALEGTSTSASGDNYGVRSFSTGGTSGTNYGIYASASNGGTNYAGYFEGHVTITGTLTESSDERLKKDISTIENALESLKEIRGTSYYWKEKDKSTDLQYGVIAQEIETIFPHLVKEGADGMKSVNYTGLIPVLIEAIKQLQNDKQSLEKKVADLLSQKESTTIKASIEIEKLNDRLERIEALLRATPVQTKTKVADLLVK